MSPLIVAIAAFIGVAALVGGVAMMLRGDSESATEDRLDLLTGTTASRKGEGKSNASVLTRPLEGERGKFEVLFARIGSLNLIFEQADTKLTPAKFMFVSVGFGVAGAISFVMAGVHPGLAPILGLFAAGLPLMWLFWRRKRRLKKFAAKLPDALELIARALRAGHSLASGFQLVANEMSEPISKEFGRVFEEQNLGIPLEEALESIMDRVPNMDLRFFCTAVILQRSTGGDLAEILDKIGSLIRERFKIWGQVQALTGEGRLSGIVLLALPPLLFLAVYRLNPGYCMVLFTDEMGKKMLIGAAIMQLLGALVIRKIVNIKV